MNTPSIFDVHSHFLPDVYIDALVRHGALPEDGFPTPSWSAESHLPFMGKVGISWSLISRSSPHPYFGDAAESAERCRAINEEGASLMRKHPTRFGYSACLPLPDTKAAVKDAVLS